jgi:lysophospholipase L1-like esterase
MGISRSSLVRLEARIKWFVLRIIVLVPVVLLVLLVGAWLQDHIPIRLSWQAGLVFLIALEVAYILAAVSTIVGVPTLAFVYVHGRRIGVRRQVAARGLLACVSLLLGLLLAESACGLWLRHLRQLSVMPIGGLSRSQDSQKGMWPPVSWKHFPLPMEFSDPPGDPAIDLVVVGESSAEGVPYNQWLSIGSLVAWKLEEAIPGRPVRLHVVATSGEILELQHERLLHLSHRPDLIIVYCGHNEFSSRLPGNREVDHYLDQNLPGGWEMTAGWVESVSPACELIRETAEKCRLAIPPRRGDRTLVDVPAYTSVEYALLLADFRRRLEAIATYAERIGAIAVLVLPPANDAGLEPNRSFLPAAAPRAVPEAFQRDFESARRLETADRARAIATYRRLISRQPGFAESHYRLARLLDLAGDADDAYRHYVAARDHDGYPMRCMTAFQEVYRDVAARHHGILIDGQSYFHAIGPRGLLDNHLFHDGMHPSLRGQIALAQAVLHALRDRHAFGWPESSPAPVIDPAPCAARFGMNANAWRYICLWGILFYKLAAPLRYDPEPRVQLQFAFANAADRIEAGDAPESLGLPNVGVPGAVPVVSMAELQGRPVGGGHHPESPRDPAERSSAHRFRAGPAGE